MVRIPTIHVILGKLLLVSEFLHLHTKQYLLIRAAVTLNEVTQKNTVHDTEELNKYYLFLVQTFSLATVKTTSLCPTYHLLTPVLWLIHIIFLIQYMSHILSHQLLSFPLKMLPKNSIAMTAEPISIIIYSIRYSFLQFLEIFYNFEHEIDFYIGRQTLKSLPILILYNSNLDFKLDCCKMQCFK